MLFRHRPQPHRPSFQWTRHPAPCSCRPAPQLPKRRQQSCHRPQSPQLHLKLQGVHELRVKAPRRTRRLSQVTTMTTMTPQRTPPSLRQLIQDTTSDSADIGMRGSSGTQDNSESSMSDKRSAVGERVGNEALPLLMMMTTSSRTGPWLRPNECRLSSHHQVRGLMGVKSELLHHGFVWLPGYCARFL